VYTRKLLYYIMWLVCTTIGGQNRYGLVWAIIINPPELPIQWWSSKGCTYCKQTQVCCCIRAHPRVPHQNTKRESSDASKSQL